VPVPAASDLCNLFVGSAVFIKRSFEINVETIRTFMYVWKKDRE